MKMSMGGEKVRNYVIILILSNEVQISVSSKCFVCMCCRVSAVNLAG